MAKIEKIAAKSVYDPPTYSQAIRVSGAQTVVFVAGQVPYDKKGGAAHPGDFKAQAREVFRSVVAQVKAAGGSVQSIVKINSYVTDIRYRAGLHDHPAGGLRREAPRLDARAGRGAGPPGLDDRGRGDRGDLGSGARGSGIATIPRHAALRADDLAVVLLHLRVATLAVVDPRLLPGARRAGGIGAGVHRLQVNYTL